MSGHDVARLLDKAGSFESNGSFGSNGSLGHLKGSPLLAGGGSSAVSRRASQVGKGVRENGFAGGGGGGEGEKEKV
jgi:hypothetical protein